MEAQLIDQSSTNQQKLYSTMKKLSMLSESQRMMHEKNRVEHIDDYDFIKSELMKDSNLFL